MTEFVPQNSYTKEELIACGKGQLFGPGNARLPLPNMLMVDRIVEINRDGGKYGRGEIIAELDITPDLFLPGLDRCPRPGPCPGLRRGQVQWPGAAQAPQDHLSHPHEARDEQQAGAGHRRCRDERGRPQDLRRQRSARGSVHQHGRLLNSVPRNPAHRLSRKHPGAKT